MRNIVRRCLSLAVLSIIGAAFASAQLTSGQKIFDFQVLASLYAKRYAPLDWKKQLLGYDHLDLRPGLERTRGTKDDLEYFELLVEYVASLQDTHSSYRLRSDFAASLGFTVDVYSDETGEKDFYVIDSITRSRLPESRYPFQTGDEVVSIDGVPADDLARGLMRIVNSANPVSARRIAASYFTSCGQSILPRLPESIGDEAVVEVRRASSREWSYPWMAAPAPASDRARRARFGNTRRGGARNAGQPGAGIMG